MSFLQQQREREKKSREHACALGLFSCSTGRFSYPFCLGNKLNRVQLFPKHVQLWNVITHFNKWINFLTLIWFYYYYYVVTGQERMYQSKVHYLCMQCFFRFSHAHCLEWKLLFLCSRWHCRKHKWKSAFVTRWARHIRKYLGILNTVAS